MAKAKVKKKDHPMPKAPEWPIGLTITDARPMTRAELEAEGWAIGPVDNMPVVLILNDGTKLYPSQDPEGNGPGCMFGVDGRNGKTVRLA